MKKHNVKKFVFSSSAAVYGIPTTKVLGEDHPKIQLILMAKQNIWLNY
jgi:UDP-glucose 4-epimerase